MDIYARWQAETIVLQQAMIDRLMADVAVLKQALFGSRREGFVDNARQA